LPAGLPAAGAGAFPPVPPALSDRSLRAHAAGRLAFFGEIESLRCRNAFTAHLAPLRRKNWFVYAKPPFAGPEAVLAYLARYTHRVAISNSRLLALDPRGVTFRYKDYRRNGQTRYRSMTLSADEFIRRFLLHVLPKGFHRIRHYGLLASATGKANIARARELTPRPCRRAIHQPSSTTLIRRPARRQTIARRALAAAGG
jgi:Putative transposase